MSPSHCWEGIGWNPNLVSKNRLDWYDLRQYHPCTNTCPVPGRDKGPEETSGLCWKGRSTYFSMFLHFHGGKKQRCLLALPTKERILCLDSL